MAENGGIPTEAARFRAWADKTCVDWNPDLHIAAWEAWRELESIGGPGVCYERFQDLFRRG